MIIDNINEHLPFRGQAHQGGFFEYINPFHCLAHEVAKTIDKDYAQSISELNSADQLAVEYHSTIMPAVGSLDSLQKQIAKNLLFFSEEHFSMVKPFMRYDRPRLSSDRALNSCFVYLRKHFTMGSDCPKVVIIGNPEEFTRSTIDALLQLHDGPIAVCYQYAKSPSLSFEYLSQDSFQLLMRIPTLDKSHYLYHRATRKVEACGLAEIIVVHQSASEDQKKEVDQFIALNHFTGKRFNF